MKIIQLFGKTPSTKKFNFTPRFYNQEEEERKERELRIKKELAEKGETSEPVEQTNSHRSRIAGSFKAAKKTATVQADPSASMLRLVILLVLAVGLIAFLQFGNVALYVLVIFFFPFYFYLKFRKGRK